MTNTPPQLVRLAQLQGSAQKGDLHPRGRHGRATQSSGSAKPLVLLLLEVFASAALKCCHKLCLPAAVYRTIFCGATTYQWAGQFKHSYLAFLACTSVLIHGLQYRYAFTWLYMILIWLYIKKFTETWMWVTINRKTVSVTRFNCWTSEYFHRWKSLWYMKLGLSF